MDNDRSTELVQKFVERRLSDPGERQKFLAAIAANPDFARAVQEQMVLHTLLCVRHQGFGALPKWKSVAAALASGDVEPAAESSHAQRESAHGKKIPFVLKRHRIIVALTAAAAVVAVVFGLRWYFPKAGDYGAFKIVARIGAVNVQDKTVTTEAQSFCAIRLADGSIVACDQNTAVDLARLAGSDDGFEQQRGRIYCEMAPQKKPFAIQSGDAVIQVLGTEFEVAQDDAPHVSVFHGRVSLTRDRAGVFIGSGQTAWFPPADAGRRMIQVTRSVPSDNTLAWTRNAGIDATKALADSAAAKLPHGDPLMDFSDYRVIRGSWSIGQTNGDVVIRQDAPAEDCHIHFGAAKWKRGELSFKFRVIQAGAANPCVGMEFFDSSHSFISFASQRGLKQLMDRGHHGWFRVRCEFEVTDSTTYLKTWDVWPEEAPRDKLSAQNWIPHAPVQPKGKCGIGFAVGGCASEITEIRLKNAVPAEKP